MPMMSVRETTPGQGPLPEDGVKRNASAVPSAAFTSSLISGMAVSFGACGRLGRRIDGAKVAATSVPAGTSRQFVDHRVPVFHAMGTGAAEAAAAQLAADHQVEVAMGDQRGLAVGTGTLDQDVGGPGGAVLGLAVVLDLGVIAGMPKDAGDHR